LGGRAEGAWPADNVIHPNPNRRLAKFDDRRAAAKAKLVSRKAKAVPLEAAAAGE